MFVKKENHGLSSTNLYLRKLNCSFSARVSSIVLNCDQWNNHVVQHEPVFLVIVNDTFIKGNFLVLGIVILLLKTSRWG